MYTCYIYINIACISHAYVYKQHEYYKNIHIRQPGKTTTISRISARKTGVSGHHGVPFRDPFNPSNITALWYREGIKEDPHFTGRRLAVSQTADLNFMGWCDNKIQNETSQAADFRSYETFQSLDIAFISRFQGCRCELKMSV